TGHARRGVGLTRSRLSIQPRYRILRPIFAAGELKFALNINVLPRSVRGRVGHNICRAAFHRAVAHSFFTANPLLRGTSNLTRPCTHAEKAQTTQVGDTKT